ncbi:hypothetical protein Tco_1357625, partial [Tanacetum coccineum]
MGECSETESHVVNQIGNGKKIFFWHDNWSGKGTLSFLFGQDILKNQNVKSDAKADTEDRTMWLCNNNSMHRFSTSKGRLATKDKVMKCIWNTMKTRMFQSNLNYGWEDIIKQAYKLKSERFSSVKSVPAMSDSGGEAVRKLAPKSSGGSGDVGNGNGVFGNLNEGDECLPLNTNVNVSDQPTLPAGVGGSKRRVMEMMSLEIDEGGFLPMNANVSISGEQNVGGSKRRRIRQLDSAGPSQAMCDHQHLGVPSDMSINVPNLQMPS